MPTQEPELDRSEIVSKCLRSLALEIDPKNGHLKSLADDIGVHPMTLTQWISQGWVPEFQYKKLLKRFNKKLVDPRILQEA